MAPTLYMINGSPPVRSVMLCAEALGLELNKKPVNFFKGEHHQPEYLKINPQHTVPVLDDDGFVVVDSHAIMSYLVSKYGKDDSLYPKDLKQRATVDHRLHFDTGILFARGIAIIINVLFKKQLDIPPEQISSVEDAYSIIEKFLSVNGFVAGDHLTIADFSFLTSITSFNLYISFSDEKYPKIAAWLKKMQALPYHTEGNQVGLDALTNMWQKTIEK